MFLLAFDWVPNSALYYCHYKASQSTKESLRNSQVAAAAASAVNLTETSRELNTSQTKRGKKQF
jgi:hypothetical protein